MKTRFAAWITVLLMTLLLVSCGRDEPEAKVVTLTIGGQEMTVTFEPANLSVGTVQAPNGTYTFACDRSGDLNIIYPDGSEFTYRKTGNAIAGLASPTFDPESKGYPSGITMAWGIEEAMDQARGARKNDGANPLLGVLLLALGAWNAFAPQSVWYLSHGWRFKNAEPSDTILSLYVIGGVILLLAGGVCLLAAVF